LGCCPADLGLVVSELATNACVHARSPFMVTVERHDACGGCGEGLGDDPGRGGQISLGRPGLFVRHRLRRANAPTWASRIHPNEKGAPLESKRCVAQFRQRPS
jgi:two-component sensor histidine kinase